MNGKKVLGFLITLVWLASGCSGMKTARPLDLTYEAIQNQQYQLRVKTGNMAMDKIIYEFAFLEFSRLLTLVEQEPFTGSVDVIFSSTAESPLLGATTGFASTGSLGWYTGSGYGNLNTNSLAIASGIKQGGTFTWQNSTMILSLKDADGRRIWVADYNYRGQWEISGLVVNTADEAARLCIQRIADQFKIEFLE